VRDGGLATQSPPSPSAVRDDGDRTAEAEQISESVRFAIREVTWFVIRNERVARPVPAELSRALLSPAAVDLG